MESENFFHHFLSFVCNMTELFKHLGESIFILGLPELQFLLSLLETAAFILAYIFCHTNVALRVDLVATAGLEHVSVDAEVIHEQLDVTN